MLWFKYQFFELIQFELFFFKHQQNWDKCFDTHEKSVTHIQV